MKTVLLALLALMGGGAVYSSVQGRRESRRFPPPGMLVDVGGYRLHVHCEGSGAATVVLDAGAGAWSVVMRRLQRQLRDSVRVCAYDRAGLGWSDVSPRGQDIGSSVRDLRSLLAAVAGPQPVILVGHSLGANIAQVYAATHPQNLAGVILLDPARQDEMLEGYAGRDSAAAAIDSCGWKCVVAAGLAAGGVTRLVAGRAGRKNLDPEDRMAYRAGIVKPHVLRTTIGVLSYLPKSGIQTRGARDFGALPVTILYSGNTRGPKGKETPDSVARWHAATLDSMRALLAGTTNPRGPIVIPDVTHTTMIFDGHSLGLIMAEVMRLARRQ